MIKQQALEIATSCRGFTNITSLVENVLLDSDISQGLCHLFLMHTSASLIICENADPLVRSDLEAFMQRLIPDGDKLFQHDAEGIDDMPAHVRTILTQTFITVPIKNNQLVLGTWQSIYLWEQRLQPYRRKLMVTIFGE